MKLDKPTQSNKGHDESQSHSPSESTVQPVQPEQPEQPEKLSIRLREIVDDAQVISHYEEALDIAVAKLEALIDTQVREANKKVDRFEVIDDTGRAYVKGSIYGSPVSVELSYQDDNRTLKVFVKDIGKSNG